jgi:hypothetical protein
MTGRDLPLADPLMVRCFTPRGQLIDLVGGVLVLDTYDVDNVGPVTSRLAYDEDVVDCSHRIVEITNAMIMAIAATLAWSVFPSRRWRNFRTGEQIERVPDADHPLLYIGNPIRLLKDGRGIEVIRSDEFTIKSGPELEY